MKNYKLNLTNNLLAVLALIFCFSFSTMNAKTKKLKPRLSVGYYKEGNTQLLKIAAKYKEHRKFKMAAGLPLKIYTIVENDSLLLIGEGKLNQQGKLDFNVAPIFINPQDEYQFKVIYEGSKTFKNAHKSITIKPANLNCELIKTKEGFSVKGTLTDKDNQPISGVELKVQLQRLFSPLPVNNDIHFTDENGTVIVPITKKMPGLNGILNYEVVLKDSDDYGTIKAVTSAKIGSEIKDLSTFDQRTMWSPPRKAPWVDLLIPNLLILGIWGTLILLIINLFKISKNKN
ncbi:MAG: hypothetical protein ACWA42_02750 [Lutibacter sp.]